MDILIENIKGLVTVCTNSEKCIAGSAMSQLSMIEDAFLLTRNGQIDSFGPMKTKVPERADKVIDASGKFVFPSFVDSHTHLVFAGSREQEFVNKIKGMSYGEIASKGGGILNSAKRLQNTSESELYDDAQARITEVVKTGTGAIEIKSGYGLTTRDEIKMLRVARKLKESAPVVIKTTFLGAHAIPEGIHRKKYINTVINEMIPEVAGEGLADYCDVFCEKGFFSPDETQLILEQGLKFGLKPKIHANQLHVSGGVQAGVASGAISVDHLESIGEEEIACLKNSTTIPTLLPGAAFFLNMEYAPARELISAGLPVTIASDYNPGSSPTGNMPLILSLACIKMRMTPEESIIAATINGAHALELSNKLGSISKGKMANIFITKSMPSLQYLPYAYGSRLVDTVILNGQIF